MHFKWKLYPYMTTIRAFFPTNEGTFFQFLKRAGETSLLPPFSYAPATVYYYHELKYFISNCDTKHNVIGIFERCITKLRPYLLNIGRKKYIHMITNPPNDLWEELCSILNIWLDKRRPPSSAFKEIIETKRKVQ